MASRLVSVFPLVTTRALSQPFTYSAENGISRGSVVTVPLGRQRVRGVVIGLDEEAPAGVTVAPVERVVDEVPEPLVDLALWLADYYGSTPGRGVPLGPPYKAEPPGGRAHPGAGPCPPGESRAAAVRRRQQAAPARGVRPPA